MKKLKTHLQKKLILIDDWEEAGQDRYLSKKHRLMVDYLAGYKGKYFVYYEKDGVLYGEQVIKEHVFDIVAGIAKSNKNESIENYEKRLELKLNNIK